METLIRILSWVLSLFKRRKSIHYETPDVTWVRLSREDRRNYARFCKRKGISTISNRLPEYVTSRCHTKLKQQGIVK